MTGPFGSSAGNPHSFWHASAFTMVTRQICEWKAHFFTHERDAEEDDAGETFLDERS